jgi:hypothetical protein
VGSSPYSATAVDINDDGRIDIVVANGNSNTLTVLQANPTGVNDITQLVPEKFSLSQNHPNPFNPSTVIEYQVPKASKVKLLIYDMLGREVATLVDGVNDAGYHTVTFDGSRLTSGIYFARIIASPLSGEQPFVQVRKMLMIK